MAKRMIIMLLAVGLVLGAVFGFQAIKARIIAHVMASFANPPQTVSTVTAGYQEWQPSIRAVGTLRAVQGADLALQLPGIVSEIDFESGQDVTKGQVLLRLRSEDDAAKLHALEATAELSRINYERDQKLPPGRVISQATLDSDATKLASDAAQVAQQRAIVDQKVLRAPFSGRLGIRAVDLGEYLAAGTTVVSLQSLDPIYVDFHLPQQDLARIKVGQAVDAAVDTWPGRRFVGKISAISPEVDTGSRNVTVRAELANPEHALLPGMFATLEIESGAPERRITLPQTAIAYNSYGDTIFTVVKEAGGPGKEGLVARQSFVTLGAARGDQVAVLAGVKEGDVVVSTGQMKLRNGSPVLINNKVQPLESAHPTLIDP